MIDLRVEFPASQQRRLLRFLDPAAVNFAEVQALNRTRANVQTLALKLVSTEMGIPVSKLKKRGRDVRVGIDRAGKKAGKFGAISPGRKATRRRLETSVRGFGRPFNVGRWDAEEVRAGASVSLGGRKRKGKGRPLGAVHSAYGRRQFARATWMLKNGAVVKREGKSFKGVYGPGVTQVLEYRHIRRKLEREAIARFERHFRTAIEFAFTPGATRVIR